MLIQQGDVLIRSVDSIPNSAKEVPRIRGKLVLAEGEASGHLHAVAEPHAKLFEDKDQGKVFLMADADIVVKHDEHKAVTVPPGQFEVYRVNEYDHFAEEARQVAD